MKLENSSKVSEHVRTRKRIIVSGIGTGGHYYPAIVVAKALEQRCYDILFLARQGNREEKVARDYGLNTVPLDARPFYGKSLINKMASVIYLLHAMLKLHALTRNAIGFAFGGFGAVPLILSCIVNRRMFYIFEPNRVPGRATRRFAARASRVFLGLPSVEAIKGKTTVTGIPVRHEFKEAGKKRPRRNKNSAVSVLIYGGSQGAHHLNDLAIEMQAAVPKKWRLTIIAGARDYERVVQHQGARTRVVPFTEQPWLEINQADIIISRAGALAGYEILCSGKKVIFIPFPYAIDRHQYYNAEYFTKIGDALLYDEAQVTAGMLVQHMQHFLSRKQRPGDNIVRDADQRIADYVTRDLDHEEQ